MREKDLHGLTVEEAMRQVDALLSEIIIGQNKKQGTVRLITGQGEIKNKLLTRLTDEWDVDVKQELGNSGSLIVEWNWRDIE